MIAAHQVLIHPGSELAVIPKDYPRAFLRNLFRNCFEIQLRAPQLTKEQAPALEKQFKQTCWKQWESPQHWLQFWNCWVYYDCVSADFPLHLISSFLCTYYYFKMIFLLYKGLHKCVHHTQHTHTHTHLLHYSQFFKKIVLIIHNILFLPAFHGSPLTLFCSMSFLP